MKFQDIIDETFNIIRGEQPTEQLTKQAEEKPEPTEPEKLAQFLDTAATEDDICDEIGKFAVLLDWAETQLKAKK